MASNAKAMKKIGIFNQHPLHLGNDTQGKGLDTCYSATLPTKYSATYMSQTCDQQRFTTSEVAADWLEPMVPQRIM